MPAISLPNPRLDTGLGFLDWKNLRNQRSNSRAQFAQTQVGCKTIQLLSWHIKAICNTIKMVSTNSTFSTISNSNHNLSSQSRQRPAYFHQLSTRVLPILHSQHLRSVYRLKQVLTHLFRLPAFVKLFIWIAKAINSTTFLKLNIKHVNFVIQWTFSTTTMKSTPTIQQPFFAPTFLHCIIVAITKSCLTVFVTQNWTPSITVNCRSFGMKHITQKIKRRRQRSSDL